MPVGQNNVYKEGSLAGETDLEADAYSRTVLVRMLGTAEGEPYGEVIHWNLLKPVPFNGLSELLSRIDGIADFLGLFGEEDSYHQPGADPKETYEGLPAEYRERIPARQRAREGFGRETYLKKSDWTVRVELIGKYHKSFQGRIRGRMSGQGPIYFCSSQELMDFLMKDGQPPERQGRPCLKNYAFQKGNVKNRSKL